MKLKYLCGCVPPFWSFPAFSGDMSVWKNIPYTLLTWRDKHSPFLPSCARSRWWQLSLWLCVEWGPAALAPLRTASPSFPWIWKNVQALRSLLDIQAGNERKDTVHRASFLGQHELWKGWPLDDFSFMMGLMLVLLFPSHSWILSHQALSLFSWEGS